MEKKKARHNHADFHSGSWTNASVSCFEKNKKKKKNQGGWRSCVRFIFHFAWSVWIRILLKPRRKVVGIQLPGSRYSTRHDYYVHCFINKSSFQLDTWSCVNVRTARGWMTDVFLATLLLSDKHFHLSVFFYMYIMIYWRIESLFVTKWEKKNKKKTYIVFVWCFGSWRSIRTAVLLLGIDDTSLELSWSDVQHLLVFVFWW